MSTTRRPNPWREMIETVAIALALAIVIRLFVVETIEVSGYSMEPTLYDGERMLINKFIYWTRLPKTGDIVVFKFPGDTRKEFIKRVIAHEGQTVEIRFGQVYVDDEPLHEPYLDKPWEQDYPKQEIQKGHIFVLGDNRNFSEDSRHPAVGQVPLKNVQGMAFVRFWPFDRFKWMPR